VYLGTRSRTIQYTALLMMAYYLPRRRSPAPWLIALVFAGLFVLVGFQAGYRSQFTDLSLHLERVDLTEARLQILPGFAGGSRELQLGRVSSGAEFNCVMAAVELVPTRVPYNYGSCLLEFATRLIPRQFWPAKRYPHYEAFTPIYDQGNLSAFWVTGTRVPIMAGPAFTFVGHYYAMGGPLALVVAGLLTGTLFRLIRSVYELAPGNQSAIVIYPWLVGIGFFEAAGTPLFWIFTVPVVLLPLGLAIYLARERTARPGPI
jgi:hypothetical protein